MLRTLFLLSLSLGLFIQAQVQLIQGANCSGRIIPKDLTATTGIIQTPNFPHKFPTPYCKTWVIDAGPYDPDSPKYIHLYYTQPYFKNMTFPHFIVGFHEKYPPIGSHSSTVDNTITKSRSRRWVNPLGGDKVDHPHNLDGPLTSHWTLPSERYLSIQVEINSLYNTHFRARDGFLNVYGFNLTYEISNNSLPRENRCSIYTCSAAGDCYAAADYKSFFCGCHEGHSGKNCEYSDICDPKRNINPCFNGGLCRTVASGSVNCQCKPGFIEDDCSRRNATSVKACPGPDCEENCDKQGSVAMSRPCSCHNGTTRSREGLVRYEVEFPFNWTMTNENSNDSSSELGLGLPSWDMKTSPNNLTELDLKIKLEIEMRLTKRLKSRILALEKLDTVNVVSFGSNSLQIRFFGPPEVFELTEATVRDFEGLEVYSGITLSAVHKFKYVPPLKLEDVIVKPKGVIKEGENYSITCSATGSSNTTFKWYKDNTPIDTSIILWGRITEMKWGDERTFKRTSTLNFDKSHVNDRGKFTCQVSDEDQEQCKDFEMDILAKPNINLNVMSLTLLKNTSDTVLTCSATLDDGVKRKWSYDWKINGELIGPKHTNEVKEDLYPQGSCLTIIKAKVSKTYTCIVSNNAGEDSMDVRVEVLESVNSPSCPKQVDRLSRLSWAVAAPNQTAKRLCPEGYIGFARRTCLQGTGNPEWGDPDLSKCVSLKLKAIDKSVQNARLGFTDRTRLPDLVRLLGDYLRTKYFLYLGEGERVIAILNDMGTYALMIKISDPAFFKLFLDTTTLFLAYKESCFYEQTVISLCNNVYKMAVRFCTTKDFTYNSDAFYIQGPKMSFNSSLVFTNRNRKPSGNWQDFRLEIPPNNEGREAAFVIVLINNMTFPVTPRERLNSGNPVQLISHVVFIDSIDYQFFGAKTILLRFTLSSEWAKKINSRRYNVTCGSLDNNPTQSMSWKQDDYEAFSYSKRTVDCRHNRFGRYGILAFPIDYVEVSEPFTLNWTVLFGCIICIVLCCFSMVAILAYAQCQIITNSIYLLKIVVCFSLIISILFILSIRAAVSSIPLTTCLCSFIILSLACHLTKALKVFTASSRLDLEWLRSVPLANLLLAITFACVLPLWTSCAAMLHSIPDGESVLSEHSPIFGTFIGTLILILILFMTLYYKAILQLKADRNLVDPDKIYILEYRIKTLNRAFAITLSTIMTTLSAILHNNSWATPGYQYFFGFSAFLTGLIVVFSYTIKSEYPIPNFITQYIVCRPEFHDPEKPSCRTMSGDKDKSPEKRYVAERQQIALRESHRRSASGSLRYSSEPETTLETLGGSSMCSSSKKLRPSSSVSSIMKRPSFSNSTHNAKIPRSLTNPPAFMNHFVNNHSGRRGQGQSQLGFLQPPLLQQQQPLWHSSTTGSSSIGGGSAMMDRPLRGVCLIRDVETCVKIPPMPSGMSGSLSSRRLSSSSSRGEDGCDYVKPSARPGQGQAQGQGQKNPQRQQQFNGQNKKPRWILEAQGLNGIATAINGSSSSHLWEDSPPPTLEEESESFLKNEMRNSHANANANAKYPAPLLNGYAGGVHSKGIAEDADAEETEGLILVEKISDLDLDHDNLHRSKVRNGVVRKTHVNV